MNGPVSQVNDLNKVLIPKEDGGVLAGTGRVDYAFGPAPGVFSIVKSDNPTVIEEMEYLSMGEGPYYTLYRPYHLASIEAPRSIGMAIINNEPGLQPKSWIAEVIGHAKKDLFEVMLEKYKSQRELYNHYINNESVIEQKLIIGAEKANDIATTVLDRVRQNIGY